MSKYSQTVEYNIKTNLDASGVQKLQTELTAVQNSLRTMSAQMGSGLSFEKEIKPALQAVQQLKTALNSSFNAKLGMLDLSKLNAQLKNGVVNAQQLNKAFSMAGAQGAGMASNLVARLYKVDDGLKSVSKTTDKIANTISNTFRWGLIASGFSQIMNAAHGAAEYVKDLDQSLTNIMMVSGQTKENMNELARQANEVAQRLGATTTQMTEAAKVFVQQGMDTGQSMQMAEYSVHLANISEQDSATTADELTAMKNAFKINIDDMGNAISKWAAIANNTAVDMEELSVASQKAASVADTVGVSMDQFAGHIAAIEATTREAPENIGNGLKTLYSRIADVKLGNTLEDGVDYGQFSTALKKIGVDILDESGKVREAGQIIEDIMDRWNDLDMSEREATATTVAGRFQLARFEALMNSQDIYRTAVNTAQAETGTDTYDQMQEDYRNSLEGRSKALQASIEGLFGEIFNTDDFYGVIDAAQGLVDVFTDLVESIGGGKEALSAFGIIFAKIFQDQISSGINNFIQNRQLGQTRQNQMSAIRDNSVATLKSEGIDVSAGNERVQQMQQDLARGGRYAPNMSDEQFKSFSENAQNYAEAIKNVEMAEEQLRNITAELPPVYQELTGAQEITIETMSQVADQLNHLEVEMSRVDNGTQRFADLMTKIANAEIEEEEATKKLDQSFQELQARMSLMEQHGAKKLIDPAQFEKLQQELQKIANEEMDVVERTMRLEEAWQQAGEISEQLRGAVNGASENLEKNTQALSQAATAAEGYQDILQQTRAAVIGFNESLASQDAIKSVTNLAMAIGQVTFAASSLKELGAIISDETISPAEKFEKIIMNLGMTIPMVLMAFTQMRDGLVGVRAAMVAQSAAMGTLVSMEAADVAAKEASVAASLKQVAGTEAVTLAQLKDIAATEGLTVAEVAQIAVNNGLTVSFSGLLAAMLPVIAAAAPFIAAFAGIAAIVAGIAWAIGEADAQWRKYDTAVENAEANTKSATEALSHATQKLSEVQSAIDGLDDNPFEGLTKGTQEWNNAMAESNNKILEMIDKYPQLAEYVTHGQNGELTFDEQGLKEYEKAVEGEVAAAQARTANAKIEENTAKETQSAVNALRAGSDDTNFTKLKAQFQTVESDPMTGYASVQYDEKGAADKIAEAAQFMAEHQELSNEDLKAALEEQGIAAGDVADELIAARDNLENLGSNLIENTAAVQAATEAYASAMLANNESYQNADAAVQTAVDAKVAELITNPTEELKQHGEQAFQDSNLNWDDGSMQDWYKNIQGYAEDVAFEAGKGFVDSAGTVIEADTGDMYGKIHDAYVNSSIAEEVAQNGDAIVQAFQEPFDRIKSAVGEDASSVFAGNGEINGEALSQDLSGTDWTKINEEDLKAMGFDSYEAFREAFNEAAANNPIKPIDEQSIKEQIEGLTGENFGLDADVDETQWKDLSKYIADSASEMDGFSEELENNADAAAEVAEEILRYDSALEKAQSSMEDWQKALTSGAVEDQAQAASELNNVYGDLLDLTEGFDLSNSFNVNPENLELLQRAMEGDVAAYDELAWRAAQDIVMQCDVDDEATLAQIDDMMAQAHSIIDSQQFKDIEIGADCNVDGLEDTLNGIITAAGMTADQANSFLASMGVDAELEPVEDQETETQEYTNLIPAQGPGETFTMTLPSGNSTDGQISTTESTFTIPGVEWKTSTGTAQDVKTAVATGVKMTAANGKSSGGKVQIKKGTVKKASSGGAKYANSSHGGGSKGGGGGGGSCFIAGTLITTIDCFKNIEDIVTGDIVISYNEQTHLNEYSKVLQTMVHDVREKLYTLYIEGESLEVTGIHRFYIKRNDEISWTAAQDLRVKDLVKFADGSWHKISAIGSKVRTTTVYNFEVSDNHNYYVGRNQILAHNKGGGGGKKGGSAKQPASFDKIKKSDYQKRQESEIDLYSKVNSKLDELGDKLDKVDKKKSKLWGEKYRKAIEEEATLLAKENKQYEQSNQITQALIAAYRGKNGGVNDAYGIDLNGETLKKYGLTDNDKDGTVDNYVSTYVAQKKIGDEQADRVKSLQKKYNEYLKANGKYNKETGQYDVKKDSKAEKYLKKLQNQIKDAQDAMNKAYEKANKITDVTQKYQEAWKQAREEAEKMTENSMKMEELQIDLWNRTRDTIGNLKKLNENAAYLEGFFSGMKKNNPFRVLKQDLAETDGLMNKVTSKGIKYFDDMKKKAEEVGDTASAKFWANQAKNASNPNASLGDLYQSSLQYLQSDAGKEMFYYNEYDIDKKGNTYVKERVLDQAAYQEALNNAYEDLIGYLQTIEDEAEKITQDIINIYDEEQKRMDDLNDKQETLNKKLKHQYDMVKLIHGENSAAYAELNKVNAAQVDAYLADGGIVDRKRQQMEYWDTEKAKREEALREQYKGISDEEFLRIKLSDEILQDLEDKADAAGDAFRDATEQAAEAMNQQYADANTKIAKDFAEKMLQAGVDAAGKVGEAYVDADFFDKQWEMAKKSADAYLDTVERSYELEKLRNRYQSMLKGTNDPKVQKKIKAAMDEQLKALEDQKKAVIDQNGNLEYQNALSQFDVDLANAKVELLQKQIALEEAQRNKNQMQLKRDTQGNYRYVYRANDEDVDNARQELADSDYEIYEMSKNQYTDLLQQRYQALQEYYQNVAWANERYKDDEAKKKEVLAQLERDFLETQKNIQMELGDAQAGMIEGVQHLAEDTTDYVSQTFEDIGESMQENWGETLDQIGVLYSDSLANMAADFDQFEAIVKENTQANIDTTITYTDEIKKLEEQAKQSFGDLSDTIGDLDNEQKKLNESTQEYMNIINADSGGISDAQEKLKDYQGQIESLQQASSQMAQSLKEAQEAREKAEAQNLNFQTAINTKNTGAVEKNQKLKLKKGTIVYYGRGGKQSDASNRVSYKLPADTEVTVRQTGVMGLKRDKNGKKVSTGVLAKYPITIFPTGKKPIVDVDNGGDKSKRPADRIKEAWHVDAATIAENMILKSGGYTGDWSEGEPADPDHGRWALLHQKELVLNAHDTENMLAAVSVVREVIDGLKTSGNSIFNTLGRVSQSNSENTIEQRVEISAEFPNVDDASDVRQALLALSDSAYQYAYKNKGRSA